MSKINKPVPVLILCFVTALFLALPVVAAPPFIQEPIEQGDLTVVIPSILVFPSYNNITFNLDVLNATYKKLNGTFTTCTYDIVKHTGEAWKNGAVFYDTILNYWYFNITNIKTTEQGYYNAYIYCNNSLGQAGYGSLAFEINGIGQDTSERTYITWGLLAIGASIVLAALTIGINYLPARIGLGILTFMSLIYNMYLGLQVADMTIIYDNPLSNFFESMYTALMLLSRFMFWGALIIALLYVVYVFVGRKKKSGKTKAWNNDQE